MIELAPQFIVVLKDEKKTRKTASAVSDVF
jgi:hypothetical protein